MDDAVYMESQMCGSWSTEFKAVLDEIPLELTVYREEFEKLYRTFIKSHEGEARLIKRSSELFSEIGTGKESMHALKNDISDTTTEKRHLQMDIEVAWNQVAELHKVEAEKQSKLNELRSTIAVLNEQISSGAGWTPEQEARMTKLKQQKLTLQQDVATKSSAVSGVRGTVETLYGQLQTAEELVLKRTGEITELSKNISTKKSQTEKETRRKAHLERSLKDMRSDLEDKKKKTAENGKQMETEDNVLMRKEIHLREAKRCMDLYLREYENLSRREELLEEESKSQYQLYVA